MKTPSLRKIRKQIVESFVADIEIGDDYYADNWLCYNEDGWNIEIGVQVEGEWHTSGDGYWEPYDKYCCGGNVYIDEALVEYYDEDDNPVEIPQEEIDDFVEYLKNQVKNNLYDY